MITLARAQPSHVSFRVEQPAYARLPIWLDLRVDDPCIAPGYSGSPDGSAEGGSAQVAGPDGTPRKPAFQFYDLRHGGFARRIGDCPSSAARGEASALGTTRIPLHLVADMRRTGQYSARWSVPYTTKLGKIPPATVSFVVYSSTGEQREAWLRDLLAHTPDNIADLRQTYIPALLAAPDDPRVTRKLLDILCAPDKETGQSVLTAFGPVLPDESLNYLAHLIEHGCLTDTLWRYFNRTIHLGHMLRVSEQQKWPPPLRAALTAILHAHGESLATGIGIIAMLEPGPADEMAKRSEAAIRHAAPEIIAGRDVGANQFTYSDRKDALINAFKISDQSPQFRSIFRAIAAQNDDAAGYALVKLIYMGNPADIRFLRTRLMGNMDGWGFEDPIKAGEASPETQEFALLPKKFGPQGERLLQSLMQARNPHIRAVAAILLANQGNRAAIAAILAALRNGQAPDQIALMNQFPAIDDCSGGFDACNCGMDRKTDLKAQWVIERKAVMIKYYEARLPKLQ